MNLSIIGSKSSFINLSDNAMAQSAIATDKARISNLESENEKLQEEVRELTNHNQSLQGQIAQAKSAVKVDISNNSEVTESREMSEKTKEFTANNNINYANESANFTKQNVQVQAGSMSSAQANTTPSNVQGLVAQA